MSPDLGRLAVFGVDDMDEVELKLLAGPFGADRGERDRVVVAGQDVVQLWPERAARQFRDLARHDFLLEAGFTMFGSSMKELSLDVLPKMYRSPESVVLNHLT